MSSTLAVRDYLCKSSWVSSIRIFILGSLEQRGPMHGHQLRLLAEQEHVAMWTDITVGGLYGALKRLATENLIAQVRVEQPFRQPIRSASTVFGTPPSTSKHSARNPSVVSDRSLSANRTNRNRDQASTAQNTCSRPSAPQSMTSVSPGVHVAGRRPR